MSRLFQGRNAILKKSHTRRTQSTDKGSVPNVSPAPPQLFSQSPSPLAPLANKLQEKQVNVLVSKLENKLPCNSGLTLSAVEGDQIMEQVIGSLVKLTISSPDYIVWSLCRMLEKLYKRALPDGTFPEDVLDSQLYVLKTLTQALNARWPVVVPGTEGPSSPNSSIPPPPYAPPSPKSTSLPASPSRHHSTPYPYPGPHITLQRNPTYRPSNSSLRSDATSTSWFEPAPFDDATARYALSVASIFLRDEFNNGSGGAWQGMYPWHVAEWEPALSVPKRTHKRRRVGGQDAGSLSNKGKDVQTDKETEQMTQMISWEQTALPVHGMSGVGVFPGGSVDMENGISEGMGEGAMGTPSRYTMYAHGYARDEALHGSYFASVSVLIKRYAGRVVYNLSASNWPIVFARVKNRLHVMADDRNTSTSHPHSPVSNSHTNLQSPLSQSQTTFKDFKRMCKGKTEDTPNGTPATDSGTNDGFDDVDLKLLSVCVMDRTRLMIVLQEFILVFREMPTAAQDTASLALRAAILNWADNFPRELMELWSVHIYSPTALSHSTSVTSALSSAVPSNFVASNLSSGSSMVAWGSFADHGRKRRMMEGLPEMVFDMLHDSHKENPRRVASLYPALAALICMSPDRLDSAIDAADGSAKVSKKNNFLTLLEHSLVASAWSSSPNSFGTSNADQAAFAHLDILRIAFYIPPSPPGQEEPSLRSIGIDLAYKLKNFMLNPPTPLEPFYASTEIDINFCAYSIAAIFRFHPQQALKELILLCLEPEMSPAVKLSAVKALVLLVVEAPKHPWQPSIEFMFPVITPRLRSIFMSCTTGCPEVIDGVTRQASSFPVCKSLAAARSTNSPLANVIHENLRLLVQIETLFPLEPSFWLYGTTDADHSLLMDQAKPLLEPHRDKREQAATVMALCATLTRSLNIPPGAPCYEEAMRYLLFAAPAGLINASLMLLTSKDDLELLRMGINIMHTMLMQLAEGSSLDQDDSWRFAPFILTLRRLIEFSVWCTITSSQMDVGTTAQRCLRLLSVYERHPCVPLPSYLSATDTSTRRAVLEGLGDPLVVIVGRVAFQKRIRKHVAFITAPTPIHLISYTEILTRFSRLTVRVDQPSRESGHDYASAGGRASIDDFHEWQNTLYLLAAGARCWAVGEQVEPFPKHLIPILPSYLQTEHDPRDLVKQFISEAVRLLCSENVSVRESAKEALGSELNPKLMPVFFDLITAETEKQLTRNGHMTQSSLVFIEQSLVVMKMLLDRIDGLTAVFDNDAAGNCISIGLFINQLPSEDVRVVRLRLRYCVTVELLLVKRQYFAIRKENEFRNRLVDILVNWIDQHLDHANGNPVLTEYRRIAVEAHLAALKLFVLSAEALHVEVLEANPSPDHIHIVSRKFHHYLMTLVNTLLPVARRDSYDSASGLDHQSGKTGNTPNNEALIYELVVSGIAHLLNNNSESCKKLCLQQCYDQNVHQRVVFMKAFTRVLNLGTKFDQPDPQPTPPTDGQSILCKLVRDCQMIATSVAKVCPAGEVEALVPVLMHVFDTRRTLVDFLKALIDQEFADTNSRSELMRSNTICARMLSAFSRQHGYVYLRDTLVSLVEQMMKVPDGCSFELDPSKLPPGEDIETNADNLMTITKAFVDAITGSVANIPPVLREVCYHIAKVVSEVWPDSKNHAVGAFMFLRFFCPAIVSPESLDVEIPNHEHAPKIRRGLVLVAKILQALSNNIFFGKEAYLLVLNPFLEQNVRMVTKFLTDIHTLAFDSVEGEDQKLSSGCDDTDALVLHRFVQGHAEQIGKALLGQKHANIEGRSRFKSGKDAWEVVCSNLVDLGAALDPPYLSHEKTSQHTLYRQFMHRNRSRSTDALSEIFRRHPANEKSYAFIFTCSKIDIDIMDFELLLYLIFKAVAVPVAQGHDFDVIFDFTSFTARSRLPNAWLRLALELMPSDIRQRWQSAYLLNTNDISQSFLRNVIYLFSGLQVARSIIPVSSVAELRQYFPETPTFMESSFSASLEYSQVDVFELVHQKIENQSWTSVVLHVGADYLRIVSVKAEDVSPTLSSRTVEIIHLRDVEDVYKCNDERHIVLRRLRRGPSVTFASTDRDSILKSIQAARQRSAAAKRAPLLPASQTSDTSATLLAIALLHACHGAEYVRSAAFDLLTANCTYLGYPFDAHIPWRGSFVPANSLAFIVNFSDRISSFSPQMTLDFILEWYVGFSNASTFQKITCLQYVSPWIRNLGSFVEPHSDRFDELKVRECIHLFVDITMQDAEVYPVLQRAVWLEMGKLTPAVVNIVIEELIRAAIDSGLKSGICDQAADTLIALSTIHARSKVLTELRTVLARACNKPTHTLTETVEWVTITVLTRLALVAGHSPRLATQNQLYAPEIVHLVTMLAGTGSLTMRLSIYGMAVNLLQALHVARAEDEPIATRLLQILDELATSDCLKLFGLDRQYPSSDISLAEPASNQISVECLERITDLLMRALDLGSSSIGLANVWKARWMGLVSSVAFQASFYSQFRAFTILSHLADSNIDDDTFYQMLIVFKRNMLSSSHDHDASASILRCLRKAVPGLTSESRYLGVIFWLAVSILQAENTPLYVEAVHLLQSSIEAMDRHNMFDPSTLDQGNVMVITLMDARVPLCEASMQLDELSGLSFDADFGFALTATLWRGVRVKADLKLVTNVLLSFLRISIRAKNPRAEQRKHLDATSLPLFLGLAPCMCKEAYKQLLEDCCIVDPLRDQAETDGDDMEYRIDWARLGISDVKTAQLATSFLLTAEDSYIIEEKEKENVHRLWAEVAKAYPDLFASGMWHFMELAPSDWLSHKMDSLFSYSASHGHLQAVTSCFDIIMSRGSQTTPNGTPSASSTSLGLEVNGQQPIYSSMSPMSKDSTYLELLSEMGMSGMLEPFRRSHAGGRQVDAPDRAEQLATSVANVVELIIAQ